MTVPVTRQRATLRERVRLERQRDSEIVTNTTPSTPHSAAVAVSFASAVCAHVCAHAAKMRAMHGRSQKTCCLIAILCIHPCIESGTLSLRSRASWTVKVFRDLWIQVPLSGAARLSRTPKNARKCVLFVYFWLLEFFGTTGAYQYLLLTVAQKFKSLVCHMLCFCALAVGLCACPFF